MANAITIHDTGISIPASMLKKASQLKVRECDEESKGRFVAYVDEGESSFDVALELQPDGTASQMQCECNADGKICRHLAALLLHLSNDQKPIPQKKVKKAKQQPFELLLEEVDPARLRQWLHEILSKNKDMQLAFTRHFTSANRIYTPEDAAPLAQEGRKAILKSRKKTHVSEIKKLTELWDNLFTPLLEQSLKDISSYNGFDLFDSLINAVIKEQFGFQHTGTQIFKYLQKNLNRAADSIRSLATEDAFQRTITLFVEQIAIDFHKKGNLYMLFLIELSETCDTARRKIIAEHLVGVYEKTPHAGVNLPIDTSISLLSLATATGVLKEKPTAFETIYHENKYNIKLIHAMMGIGEYNRAEKICTEQIRRNIHRTFDIPYQQCLGQIYLLTGKPEEYRKIAIKLLSVSFNLQDYHTLMGMTEDEKFRKIISKKAFDGALDQAERYNPEASAFCFWMMHKDGDFNSMTNLIFNIPECYPQIIEYFDHMVDEKGDDYFLGALLIRSDGRQKGYSPPDPSSDKQMIETLYEKVIDNYGIKNLKKILTRKEVKINPYNPNRFASYVLYMLKNSL